MLGNGDEALDYLNQLKSYLRPNTFYSEIRLPVMETPLHGATAIQEMMLQSWGGKLRVFPAISDRWPEVLFANLRAEGGYLVSGKHVSGKSEWVRVDSEFGGQVDVAPNMNNATWSVTGTAKIEVLDDGVYRIKTSPGDSVLFWPEGDAKPNPVIEPVARRGEAVRFGLPKGYKN